MKNIVIATQKDIGYFNTLVESTKKNGFELIVLGMNKEWNGLSDKYKYWIEYLETLPDDEIVMLNDAYDVIILDTPDNILKKFKSFNKPVVCSIQKGFMAELVFSKCFNHIICTGNIVGYTKPILTILKLIVKHKDLWKGNSDQIIFNEICMLEPYIKNNIGLDTDQTLFYVTSIDNFTLNNTITDISMENGKLYNKSNTNKNPQTPISILHLAGNINGHKYLEYMGYNMKNVHPMGGYKVTQILTYIKFLLNKHRNYIIKSCGILMCVFILSCVIFRKSLLKF